MRCGKPEASSAARLDDEYLSPQEEAMELGESTKRVHFREPPSFQVGNPDLCFQIRPFLKHMLIFKQARVRWREIRVATTVYFNH